MRSDGCRIESKSVIMMYSVLEMPKAHGSWWSSIKPITSPLGGAGK